jgi:7-carboxy-7-deazaguanine synthase
MNSRPPEPPVARPATPSDSFRVSEIFLSLQGEGPSAGTPAHFVRLQGCDVGCHWCDTKYSWEFSGGRVLEGPGIWTEALALGEAPLLVLTGGEPLEHPGVAALIDGALARWDRVEIETSGVEPPPVSHPRLAYNVSPKPPSATPEWKRTWRHVEAWKSEPRATFKLVVGAEPDLEDALRMISSHALPRERVMLMPEGMTDDVLRPRAVALAEACKRHGLRMSPRLHVWMWGARRGV